uniref:Uncharacterized protein n=1 Tax=Siphoviridae sp. ctqPo10 TaxID=2827948 RepID=A0A8S5SV19_9CAUD|nr:MAG TPA: hypothetical protein [Siphoviridae sp. ctqPo10]
MNCINFCDIIKKNRSYVLRSVTCKHLCLLRKV